MKYSTIEALAAVIAHSQIVVAQPQRPMPSLPAGFDDSDIAVLDWIAAEGRRLGRRPGSSVHVSVGPCDAIEPIKSLTAARRPASPSASCRIWFSLPPETRYGG
jgi:hypothetical protein